MGAMPNEPSMEEILSSIKRIIAEEGETAQRSRRASIRPVPSIVPDPPADEPEVVADVVLQAATDRKPKLRYAAGGLANRLRLLRRFAPAHLVDAGIRKDLRLDRSAA